MATKIQTKIYKITLRLLLALCLGGMHTLSATQHSKVADEKEDIADNSQDTSPNGADKQEKDSKKGDPASWTYSVGLQLGAQFNSHEAPTPFRLLFTLFGGNLLLKVQGFKQLSIVKQCAYLQTSNIYCKDERKLMVKCLVEKELYFNDLKHKSYLRIKLKHILCEYYKKVVSLISINSNNNVSLWNSYDLITFFIWHSIKLYSGTSKDEDKLKSTWEFLSYFKRYLKDENYDGKKFLLMLDNLDIKKSGGAGLQVIDKVCKKYNLTSNLYSMAMTFCYRWTNDLRNISSSRDKKNNESIYLDWVCSACIFINPSGPTRCAMCNKKRPISSP